MRIPVYLVNFYSELSVLRLQLHSLPLSKKLLMQSLRLTHHPVDPHLASIEKPFLWIPDSPLLGQFLSIHPLCHHFQVFVHFVCSFCVVVTSVSYLC